VSTPSITLVFRWIQDPAPPVFGDTYEDITRRGATTARFRWIGKTSDETDLTTHRFYDSRSAALAGRSALAGAKGNECYLVSQLHNNYTFRAFVLDVSPGLPVRIESTEGYTWKLTVRLRVRLTA